MQSSERLNGFSIDIEANGFVFEASKIWAICIEDLDTDEKIKINPFKDNSAKEKIINWINKYDNPTIAFHNGLGYDIFVLFLNEFLHLILIIFLLNVMKMTKHFLMIAKEDGFGEKVVRRI